MSSLAQYDIFISYRRTGGFELAEVLYNRLTNLGYKVFLDIESLRSGKFNEALLERISECKDVLLLLPPNALERCINEDDWVRREITWAIKQKKNIIPIYMNGFIMPESLPEGMEDLPKYNAITASNKTFDQTLDDILSFLKSNAISQTNVALLKTVSWIKRNILAWRIVFFPIAAVCLFELFLILPFDFLQLAKEQVHINNFAKCRALFLCLSSTLMGCALWIIPMLIKQRFWRILVELIALPTLCTLTAYAVEKIAWNGLYELWHSALGFTLFSIPWVVTALAIFCTFIVKLFLVIFPDVE